MLPRALRFIQRAGRRTPGGRTFRRRGRTRWALRPRGVGRLIPTEGAARLACWLNGFATGGAARPSRGGRLGFRGCSFGHKKTPSRKRGRRVPHQRVRGPEHVPALGSSITDAARVSRRGPPDARSAIAPTATGRARRRPRGVQRPMCTSSALATLAPTRRRGVAAPPLFRVEALQRHDHRPMRVASDSPAPAFRPPARRGLAPGRVLAAASERLPSSREARAL